MTGVRGIVLPALLAAALAAQHREPLHDGWRFARAAGDGARPDEGVFAPAAVPAAWETFAGIDFDGIGWYRRTLRLEPRWRDQRVSLEFRAVATQARVFLNGVEIASHLGAWTPFRAPLTPLLRDGSARCDGSDLLEVRVDEKVGHNTQGFHPIIQPHFGGIWQDVSLRVDGGAILDDHGVLVFGAADGTLRVRAPVLAEPGDRDLGVHVAVFDGAARIAEATAPVRDGSASIELAVPGTRPWSPRAPHLFRAELTLRDAQRVLDSLARRVGFRTIEARGRGLGLNGAPLGVRGMLHWGYEPPRLAPAPEPAVWRRELEDLRARGFNLLKCCLWVPPPALYEIADELGMLVWQEYPTWHPQLTPEHRDDLVAEFEEFYRRDRSHPSVVFRSLTCETGHGADLEVIRDLYERAHRAIPQALVVDDSSWISWNRIHDFYDDHPYGNNNEWRGRLRHFDEFIAAREAKPLLFGECIASDTWFDRDAWLAEHGEDQPWWAPRCLQDQARFEQWFRAEFGAAELARLLPDSIAYAMRNRKYQIERLRLDLPEAGYVVSVMRDFTLARMGFYDDLGRAKFTPEDWAWHGDTMLCLDTAHDCRAFVERSLDLGVRIAHHGGRVLQGQLELRVADIEERAHTIEVELQPGMVSPRIAWRPELAYGPLPRRVRLAATLRAAAGTEFTNAWDLWLLPPPLPVTVPRSVRLIERLDREALDFLEGGGRAILLAGDRKGCLRGRSLWFLRGAPFAPPHPAHAVLPADLLRELQSFDLERSWVVDWDRLRGQVDPILAFWDTHDLAEVRSYLLAADTNVGKGRLLISALNDRSVAGMAVLGALGQHLADGPAPRRSLTPATLAELRLALAAEMRDLVHWQLRTDPDDRGLAEGWQAAGAPADGWAEVRAGQHWESQGFAHYDGVAWYRCAIEVPESWQAAPQVHAVFEGVDDSYRLYLDGKEIARFGDPATKETVWLQRTTVDLTGRLRPGATHRIVLRVVDHNGAGGIWKPVYLTTGPVQAASDLLH